MKEANLTTRFGHWVSANNKELPPFIFEAKIVKLDREKSLGLSKFQPHQLPFLREITTKGVYYKHPDLGNRTPGDGFFFKGEAWVVIFWFLPRKVKLCTIIRIQDFDRYFETCSKKSIRMEEAKEISSYRVDL